MGILALEIFFIVLLIAVNGVFSMSEIAVLTSKRHVLRREAKRGSARARQVLDLAGHPEKFMSAVQVGITLIGILTGVFSGATISGLLSSRFVEAYGVSPEMSETAAVFITVSVITYVTLIFGELLPKKLALSNPDRWAKAIAPVITVVQFVAHPVVVLVSRNVGLLARMLGIGEGRSGMTEEDFRSVIDEARARGIIEPEEKDMLNRVMRFADQRVSAVMTHRSRVVQIDVADGEKRNAAVLRQANHSNYPVVDGSADNLVGFVSVKDLYGLTLSAENIRSVLQEPIFIQETFSAMSLLSAFRETGNKIAIVIDEYGDVQGIVTPTDILESLVGEIREDSLEILVIAEREDGSWLVDAHAPVYDVFDRLGIDVPTDQSFPGVNTISGFILHHLGDIPRESDFFAYHGFRFEIVDMDAHRIDKILISRVHEESADKGNAPGM